MFSPIPEPHTMVGLSYADLTMDLQKINSAILRGVLDSLNLSLNPRVAFMQGQVNAADLLNPEIGRVIRTEGPPSQVMQEFSHRFVGGDALPMFQLMDGIKEKRVGRPGQSTGLNADVLQSTTKAAVTNMFSMAQERTELLARIFAETGMKQLFKGLLRTIVEHQDRPRVVRLRNQYVEVDPRSWDATMDVVVNVALGAGLTEDKLNFLGQIAQKQEQILQLLGPQNPLVSIGQYRNTLARMTELAGFKNSAEFFNEITPQAEQQMAQAAQKPDPQMLLVQVEADKVKAQQAKDQADAQLKQADLQLKAKIAEEQDDRERDKTASELTVKLKELEIREKTAIDRTEVQKQIAAMRNEMEGVKLLKGKSSRKVKVQRDEDGRIAGAEIEETEES